MRCNINVQHAFLSYKMHGAWVVTCMRVHASRPLSYLCAWDCGSLVGPCCYCWVLPRPLMATPPLMSAAAAAAGPAGGGSDGAGLLPETTSRWGGSSDPGKPHLSSCGTFQSGKCTVHDWGGRPGGSGSGGGVLMGAWWPRAHRGTWVSGKNYRGSSRSLLKTIFWAYC